MVEVRYYDETGRFRRIKFHHEIDAIRMQDSLNAEGLENWSGKPTVRELIARGKIDPNTLEDRR